MARRRAATTRSGAGARPCTGSPAGLDADALYEVSWRAYRDMLAAGFTSVAEFHYLHRRADGERATELVEAVIRAASDAGIRLAFIPVFYQRGGFDTPAGPGQARFLHRDVEDFLTWSRCTASTAPAWPRTRCAPCRPGCSADMALGARENCSARIARSTSTSPSSPPRSRPASRRRGAGRCSCWPRPSSSGRNWSLVHATHADAAERATDRRQRRDGGALPADRGLSRRRAVPGRGVRRAGGRLALGSDSNVRIDAAEELRWLEYGQRC
jgi:formimidoylglutamate deiminase